jgi:hypothetical protein
VPLPVIVAVAVSLDVSLLLFVPVPVTERVSVEEIVWDPVDEALKDVETDAVLVIVLLSETLFVEVDEGVPDCDGSIEYELVLVPVGPGVPLAVFEPDGVGATQFG